MSLTPQSRRLLATAKPLGNDVGLWRLGAARWRLGVAQLAKGSFELREQRAFSATLEYFRDKDASGSEDLRGDGECRLGESDDPQVVRRGVTRRRRRHVAQHDIGQTAELGPDGSDRGGIMNIGAQD